MSVYFEALNRRAAKNASASGACVEPVPAWHPPEPVGSAPVEMPPSPARGSRPSLRRRPKGAVADAYETLRERLAVAAAGRSLKSLLFAGCEGGEGCTRVVREFAESLASAELRILLVDANPYAGPPSATGEGHVWDLTALIRDQRSPTEKDPGAGAPTMAALLTRPPDREGFLRSAGFAAWLERVQADFHYTLLDAPPILRHADGVLASGLCDGVVLVARGGATRGSSLARAERQIAQAGGKVLGVVLTEVDDPLPAFLRRFVHND